jgi:arginyl-tRNA synthetase
MTSTYDTLLARLQLAFDVLEPGADPVLRTSDRSDFQSNGVMSLAKRLGRPPRDVAEEIVGHADLGDVASVEVAGPGFLNLTLGPAFLERQLVALLGDERLGIATAPVPKTVVIDYSAPNVAKEMHVGNLRSTVIGDALARSYRFAGHHVIARNHVGDWGTPFAMLIEHLLDTGEGESALSIGDLDGFYKEARVKFDSDDAFKERSRARVVALQSGDLETLRLWRIIVDQSITYLDLVYQDLGVSLVVDDVVGESFYNPMLADVVADLDEAGLLVNSGGALCVFPPGFTNRDGEALPLIVQKSDEGFGYAASDLAAVRDRVDNLHADEMLYVVGVPQAQHFEMVFAVARLAGWLPDRVRCEHVTFGNVLGTDRKMFKSRSGETVKLASLLGEAIERADEALKERNTDLDDVARVELAVQIARAAIKYADLSTDRQHDYVFDLDRMIAFEGDTGPYLQYAHARLRSIFRRLGETWTPSSITFSLRGRPGASPRARAPRVPRSLRGVARESSATPTLRLSLRPRPASHRVLRRLSRPQFRGCAARTATGAV